MLWALPKRNRETDVIRIENAVIALVEKRLLSVEKDRELTMVPEHTGRHLLQLKDISKARMLPACCLEDQGR